MDLKIYLLVYHVANVYKILLFSLYLQQKKSITLSQYEKISVSSDSHGIPSKVELISGVRDTDRRVRRLSGRLLVE
jgi:hypothetical protein